MRYANNNTYMFNCNYTLKHAVNRDDIKAILDDRYFDFISHEKVDATNNVYNKFLDIEDIKSLLPDYIFKNANYFICGSPNFIKAMRKNLEQGGIVSDKIFFEDFAL